jgi:predicted transcriptional regulator
VQLDSSDDARKEFPDDIIQEISFEEMTIEELVEIMAQNFESANQHKLVRVPSDLLDILSILSDRELALEVMQKYFKVHDNYL